MKNNPRDDVAGQGPGRIAGNGSSRAGPARSRSLLVLTALLLLPLALIALPTTVLLLVGMVPTLVALVVDRDPGKYAPITVGTLNFCGVMNCAIPLWRSGHSLEGLMGVLSDPFSWLVMYAAAAVGWLIYFSVPPAVSQFMSQRYHREIDRMKGWQASLMEEWGENVADNHMEE